MVSILFALHVLLALKHPYFNQFSNVEDWAYTNIAARNYLNLGFLNTFFLQDYAASFLPADHPFVYNHMPPGPDLTTAFFQMITGGDHRWTRILFGTLVLPGLYFYVRFVRLVCGPRGISGAAMALLAAGPYVVMNHLQAEVHSAFLLMCFAPMCWVIESNSSGKRYKFVAALAVVFLLSIYIQYILLAAALFAWIFLYVFRIAPITRRQTILVVATVFAGIAVHLIQNLIYLGPEIFFKELFYTIGNRTVGVPTQEDLRAFYRDVGLVHHGAQRADLKVLISTLIGNLVFRFSPLVLPAFLAWFALAIISRRFANQCDGLRQYGLPSAGLDESAADRVFFVLRLFAWAAATVVCVILLFPAHTQEVNLSTYGGINLLLFAIPTAALIGQGFIAARPLFDGEMRARIKSLIANGHNAILQYLARFYVGVLGLLMLVYATIWSLSLEQGLGTRLLSGARAMAEMSQPSLVATRAIAVFASIAIGLALAWLSWQRYRPNSDMAAAGPAANWTWVGSITRAFLAFIAIVVAASILVRASTEASQIVQRAAEPNDLAPLSQLDKYRGALFMTNINVPAIGFFTSSTGFGVCGLDSVSGDGTLNRPDCKVAQTRRQQYWNQQQPKYFFFFKQGRVFPGFATCWPKDSYLGLLRGGAGCNEKLGSRLAQNFSAIDSNELFDVYDLTKRPVGASTGR
jgi:hypothetical protein